MYIPCKRTFATRQPLISRSDCFFPSPIRSGDSGDGVKNGRTSSSGYMGLWIALDLDVNITTQKEGDWPDGGNGAFVPVC